MPSDYTALMEELASHGYAVFSIAHTGESMAVSLPGGRVEAIVGADNQLRPLPRGVIGDWGDEDSVATAITSADAPARAEATLRRYLARIPHATATVARWSADTRAVMDEVTRLAAPRSGSVFEGRIRVSQVAALGHSMGGVASAAWCARDPRCAAAINLDGSPQYGDLIDRPSNKPFLMVYSSRPGRVGVSDLIYGRGAAYWRAVVDDTRHLNFGDWQYWEAPDRMDGGLGSMRASRSTEIVSGLVRAFFAEHLPRSPASLLQTDRPYPEVEFRQLKR